MDRHEFTEELIEELRKLVGWGSTEQRLPSLPHLRHALNIPPDYRFRTAGRVMRTRLLQAIRNLPEDHYELWGSIYPALAIKIALQVLLRYDRSQEAAPDRRCWVIRHLNAGCSVERFRREDGPERHLLTILAEYLYPAEAAAA
jgi:hypothetical protein